MEMKHSINRVSVLFYRKIKLKIVKSQMIPIFDDSKSITKQTKKVPNKDPKLLSE